MTDIARLVLDADTKGLKRGERDLDLLAQASERTTNSVVAGFTRIGAAIAGAVAVSGALGSVIRTNAEFGASMSRVAAVSGATTEELQRLKETALQMGADTSFSAAQAADALGFLAMAGFDASEAMEAIPSVLSLAAASGMELASAADIASNVLSGFGKSAAEAAQVSDVLALAASRTNTNVFQLGQAMSTAAPIAAALGVSMEETAASIGVMSDAGIQGERAGTALRGVFASLAGPTTQAQEALAKYGLTAADINPETVGLANAMGILSERGLTTADAMVIFGREAASGALVMAGMSDRIKELTGDFQNAEGAADEMAATMRDNLSGDIDALTGSVETLIIRLGDAGVTGTLRTVAQVGTGALNLVSENMGTLVSVVATAAGGWAAYRVALLGAQGATLIMNSTMAANASILLAVQRNLGTAAAAQTAFGVATASASGLFRAFTAALIANPFTAVAVAVGVLTSAMIGLSQAQAQARAETDNLIQSLRGLAQARSADFAVARAKATILQNEAQNKVSALEAELNELRTAPRTSAYDTTALFIQRVESRLFSARQELVKVTGELTAADNAFDKASDAANSMVPPVAQGAQAVTTLGSALEATGGAATNAARETEQAANKISSLLDRLFPEVARQRQIAEDLATIEAAGLDGSQRREARIRIASGQPSNELPQVFDLDEAQRKTEEAVRETVDGINEEVYRAEILANKMAENFERMSQRVIYSFQNLANGIRQGDFLSILGGAIDLFAQFGGFQAIGLGRTTLAPTNRSMGGPVYAGRPYIVGENGPEMFSPPGTGRITANDNMRQDVRVMVGIDQRNGNILAFVDGRIASSAPLIADAGASRAITAQARSGYRSL